MYLQPGYGTTIDAHGPQFIVYVVLCTYLVTRMLISAVFIAIALIT